jgi:hypothetical protein
LNVVLDANQFDEVKLAVEEIDMLFLVLQDSRQQFPRDKVPDALAVCDTLAEIPDRLILYRLIGLENCG